MEDAGHPVLKGWRSYMLVEPPMLLHFFGQALTVNVIEDFLVNRCCRAQLDTNSRECATFRSDFMVRESRQWFEVVMPYFFFIMMVKYFIDGVIPACTLLFLGSWSDKYGRKPILLAGYAGSATSCLLWSILSSMDLLNPWFYLIASVPAALVGGYSSLNFATNCYITDITSDRQRAWHLTWLIPVNYAAWFFGFPAGTAIYKGFGYSRVFGAASACSAISMLYVLIFVPETVATSREKKHAYRSLFDLSLIKDTIATCVRKREDTNRLILWWCILYLSMIVLAEVGDFRIMFSIASERFGWREDDRIVYQLKERLLSGVGILLSAKIITSFIDKSMSSMLIVVFALTSSLFGAIVVENATEPRHLYLFVVFVMFSQLSKPVLRTALSKSVPPRDIGKVFSLASFMEIMMFLVAKLLYAFFYSYRRRPTHPSLIFIISAEIYVNAIAGVMPINRTFQLWNSAREQHSRRD